MIKFTIPVKVTNPLNENQWGKSGFARMRIRKKQRDTTRLVWLASVPTRPVLPCTVKLTRIAPRPLDSHDGLRAALKAIVDQLAVELGLPVNAKGHADDADPRVSWMYGQRRGNVREYVVEVLISEGIEVPF
jgi:hypothetical protein